MKAISLFDAQMANNVIEFDEYIKEITFKDNKVIVTMDNNKIKDFIEAYYCYDEVDDNEVTITNIEGKVIFHKK